MNKRIKIEEKSLEEEVEKESRRPFRITVILYGLYSAGLQELEVGARLMGIIGGIKFNKENDPIFPDLPSYRGTQRISEGEEIEYHLRITPWTVKHSVKLLSIRRIRKSIGVDKLDHLIRCLVIDEIPYDSRKTDWLRDEYFPRVAKDETALVVQPYFCCHEELKKDLEERYGKRVGNFEVEHYVLANQLLRRGILAFSEYKRKKQ